MCILCLQKEALLLLGLKCFQCSSLQPFEINLNFLEQLQNNFAKSFKSFNIWILDILCENQLVMYFNSFLTINVFIVTKCEGDTRNFTTSGSFFSRIQNLSLFHQVNG